MNSEISKADTNNIVDKGDFMCLNCRNGYNMYIHVHVTGKELLKSKKRMAAMYFQDTMETRSKQTINSEKKREERLQAKKIHILVLPIHL